jgi:hypothetical protein
MKYKDKYNQIWERIDEYRVWNKEYGIGLWDKGNGLTLINNK